MSIIDYIAVILIFEAIVVVITIYTIWTTIIRAKIKHRQNPNNDSNYLIDITNIKDGWQLRNLGIDKIFKDMLGIIPNTPKKSMSEQIEQEIDKTIQNRIVGIIKNAKFDNIDRILSEKIEKSIEKIFNDKK